MHTKQCSYCTRDPKRSSITCSSECLHVTLGALFHSVDQLNPYLKKYRGQLFPQSASRAALSAAFLTGTVIIAGNLQDYVPISAGD